MASTSRTPLTSFPPVSGKSLPAYEHQNRKAFVPPNGGTVVGARQIPVAPGIWLNQRRGMAASGQCRFPAGIKQNQRVTQSFLHSARIKQNQGVAGRNFTLCCGINGLGIGWLHFALCCQIKALPCAAHYLELYPTKTKMGFCCTASAVAW